MSLVVSQLTSTNFLGWSTAIKTALEAKGKLGFIDRSIEEPTDEEDYWKWKKADSMVKSWIVNSMTKELADFFVYCRTTRELWDELEDRFGKACGPLLYQIQREVAPTEQGSDSWCGINKRLEERESSNKLLQFLMGLHQRFKTIRTQILNFDPLPTINKAFAMVSQDEVQMDVKDMFNPLEVAAAGFKKDEMGSRRFKNKEDKKDKVCSHCQMKGHTKEECFKIVGYPEWYNDLKNQRKKSSVKKVVATAAESPLDDETENSKDWTSIISQIVRQEISKAREEKANVAYLGEFTGNISSNPDFRNDWIIDTGASSHMCSQENLMHNIKLLDKVIHIHLPNGTNIQVQKIDSCFIQDRRTKTTLAEGRVNGNIYWLKTHKVEKACGIDNKIDVINNCTQPTVCWHSSPNKDKFDKRAFKGIFVGYATGYKAYKIYNMDTHKIHVSRDVVFYENMYPLKLTPVLDLTPMPVRAFESETLKEDNEEHSDCEAPVDPIAETQHDDLDAEVQEMPHNETDDLTDVSITDHDQNSDEETLHELVYERLESDGFLPLIVLWDCYFLACVL
ncbi:uncharacterized protein G2W53_004719 [Senna tora]|uniref:Retrotransposon Copia-like N-terminal domain-containing protein n=1 Tax=Senna tora TaxID=362788 RepID=A0A834XE83_9FABA|nr:uncharacterized protein G2W53_004719 [Senna tora]